MGGGAAAAVSAAPAGARPIPLSCGAATKGDADRLLWPDDSLTLLSLASYRKRQLTIPDLAQSGFFDQPTVWVVVGQTT